ncbi:hypothetical protein CHL76_06125 [Marinococcus halophilus]|uniref:Glycerol acyltransferase n=1 Tax=Marinococcus halophilus TaxID=1371 RepID=A0A510Y598_MARHA|nr:lysophospholipid acyltransferase family protein [Marinococcus halophilus]OZT80903.1 hypothetical protein CHL76_06125 [Marinococcus halophilus]GEK57961.1 glycerol acyltransferase [Marinococcus halophilus]
MITENKQPLFEKLFYLYDRRLIQKHFSAVHMHNNSIYTDDAALFYVNHSNWWDGLLIYFLNKYWFRHPGYVMMDEEGLREFPFFRRLGAYSVDRSSRRDIIDALRYTEDKLVNGHHVWLFPQGAETHADQFPITLQPGISYLLPRVNVPFVPVTMHYTFLHHQKPEIFINIGPPLPRTPENLASRAAAQDALESHLQHQWDEMREDIAYEHLENYTTVLSGSQTMSSCWTSLRQKK